MLGEFIKKPTGMLLLLASAAGGPYVLHETDLGKTVMGTVNKFASTNNGQSKDPNSLADYSFDPTNLGMTTGGANPWNTNGSFPPSTPAALGPGFSGPTPTPYQGSMTPFPQGIQQPIGTLVSTGLPVSNGPFPVANGSNGMVVQPAPPSGMPPSIVGGPVRDLRDVIRFDITPAWVTQNFGRVTTVLADVQLDGLRVPLVTGTGSSDLAATVTYYFDNQQTLRRINLQGLSGNPAGMAALMQQYYNLKPEKSLGGHLYTTRWNNKVTSMLHVAPAPIMYATAQNSNYNVFLELNQPSMPYGLSPQAMEILQTGHQTLRW